MPTFARGYWTRRTHAQNAEHRKQLDRDNNVQTAPGRITWIITAGDELTLRGIPAIGRGVQGAIRGSRPDTIGDQ